MTTSHSDETLKTVTSDETISDSITNDENNDSHDEDTSSRSFVFWVIVSVAVSIGLCLLLFIVALAAGSISGRWENVASMVSIIRDLLLIFLILEAIIIGIAIVVMVIQLSALLNLLQNEISPIVQNTQQATKTVRGTAEFMSKRLVKPVIGTTAAFAGLTTFLREVRKIHKAVRPQSSSSAVEKNSEESDKDE
ncbi:MAG: hypothetical protein CUN55_09995 [Phototrophicales bacterium]|nr:MAG: hypothetical protein CUN55_09995 [Phototrophicales bacterium]